MVYFFAEFSTPRKIMKRVNYKEKQEKILSASLKKNIEEERNY